MLKIKRFYKPFLLSILFIVCLLGAQATCDLSLPNLMSDIVNNGIQSKGITNAAPEAISEKGFDFVNLFMSDPDKEFVANNYTLVNKGDTAYIDKYPLVKTENIYVQNSLNKDDLDKADTIFANASDAAINFLQTTSGILSDIQDKGITKAAPESINKEDFDFITSFLDTNSKSLVKKNYTFDEASNTYMLNDISESDLSIMNTIFTTIGAKLSSSMTDGNNSQSMDLTSMTMDSDTINKIYQMGQMAQVMPQNMITDAISKAQKTDSSITSQVGKTFTLGFYTELGMDTGKMESNYIMSIGLQMLGLTVIGVIAAVSVSLLASRMAAGVAKSLRKAIFEKVESFANEEFNKFSTASLITRSTNDITQIQNITAIGTRMILYSPIMGIGAVIMMLHKGSSMAWTLVLGILAMIVLIIFAFKVVVPKFKIMQKLTDRLNLVTDENLTGIMVIRAFGTQQHEAERFDEVNTTITKINRFTNTMMVGVMMPTMTLIMNLLMALIVWVGAHAIANANVQVGDMMAFIQYSMQVIMAFLMLAMMFIMLPRASVSGNRIDEVLRTPTKIKDPENPKDFDPDRKGYVEFKHVSFSYEGASEKVLDDINFIAKPGETTAFIGSTGSGKSTLINLIPRLYDVTEGEILVSGVNIKDVTLHNLHDQIGYIPQKGNLLSGTIESNLKYGNENASDEFMEECASVAQATDFIETKEDRYQDEIAQGGKNVSGGQKQRLSIARALVKNAPIYIFDDSFSALDFKTDVKLRQALKEHTSEANLLIVAQRVNTIMNAEQIIVLDEGKVVGMGTHEELLKNCPTYYEIASSQLSKEELENGRN